MNINVASRVKEIDQLRKKHSTANTSFYYQQIPELTYEPGISVIIPTCEGEDRILTCLESLVNQTLSPAFFEVIVIANGRKDRTMERVLDYIQMKQVDNFIAEYREEGNVSKARNRGIELAKKEYITFLDDDDYLSENFLEKLYQHSAIDSVAVSQIVNVETDGTEIKDHPVNEEIMRAAELEDASIRSVAYVLTMNACKTIPTFIVKEHRYAPDLKSGEDIVFFTELFAKYYYLNVNIVPIEDDAIYYRLLRDESISRQKMTFDFYVRQRLEVIKKIDSLLPNAKHTWSRQLIQRKVRSQLSFLRKYLTKFPEEKNRVLREIDKYDISYMPLQFIEPVEEKEKETEKVKTEVEAPRPV